jgi:N-6 DNA Methylase
LVAISGREVIVPRGLIGAGAKFKPYHGRILDPACGSGGMFVHSADFVRAHKHAPEKELSIFGIEKVSETQRLARMNLAVHGLGGTIREANAYYEESRNVVPDVFQSLVSHPCPLVLNSIVGDKD